MAICLPDTSCLIHLERIERLGLLQSLYDDLRVPPAVREEFGRMPEGIALEDAVNSGLVRLLRKTLDAGEAEVIALGMHFDEAHLILDDAAARREAKELELPVIGTVGLVLRAHRDGVLPAAKPVLDALRGTGFWISDALYEHALRRTGEDEGGYLS